MNGTNKKLSIEKRRSIFSGTVFILLIFLSLIVYHYVRNTLMSSALQTSSLSLSNASLSLEREIAVNNICIDNFLSDHAVQKIIGSRDPCSSETLMEAVQTLKKTVDDCSLFTDAVFASCSANTVLTAGRNDEDFSFDGKTWDNISALSEGVHKGADGGVTYVVRYPENRPVACLALSFDSETLESILFGGLDGRACCFYSVTGEKLLSGQSFPDHIPAVKAYKDSINIFVAAEDDNSLFITEKGSQYGWLMLMPLSVSNLIPKPVAVLGILHPYLVALFALYCIYFVIHIAGKKIKHVNEEKAIYGQLLSDALPEVETGLFSELLNKMERSPDEVLDSLRVMKSDFSHGGAIPILIDWLLPEVPAPNGNDKLEINAQKAGIRAMLPDILEGAYLVPEVGEKRLAVIWKPDTLNQARIISAEERLREKIEHYMSEKSGKVLVLFGDPAELVEDLYDSYRSAHRVIEHEKYFDSSDESAGRTPKQNEGTKISRLARGILSGDENNTVDALQHYCGSIAPADEDFLHELLNVIVDTLLRLQARGDEPFFVLREKIFSEAASRETKKSREELETLFKDAADLYAKLNKREQYVHVENAREIIAREYNDSALSLGQVSSALGISPSYFSTIFPIYTGMGFVEYLNDFRIKKALQLLENSDFTVQEIGFRTGFNSPQSFHRVFKKYYGETPGQYRARKNQERPYV